MNVIVIIFIIVATLFALGSLGYVAIDLILEIRNKEEKNEEPVVAVAEPVVEEEPHEFVLEIVEHINAEEADEMISDELAMSSVRYESPAGHGLRGIINIGEIDQNFEANEIITLAILKERGLINKNIGRIKILADGILNKPLTIKADSYSIQAIKMIELTGGTVIILKD